MEYESICVSLCRYSKSDSIEMVDKRADFRRSILLKAVLYGACGYVRFVYLDLK